MNKPRTVDQVAKLYDVGRATVYRWVDHHLFWKEPMTIPSPSGKRDRVLFEAEEVVEQYRYELSRTSAPDVDRIKEFLA